MVFLETSQRTSGERMGKHVPKPHLVCKDAVEIPSVDTGKPFQPSLLVWPQYPAKKRGGLDRSRGVPLDWCHSIGLEVTWDARNLLDLVPNSRRSIIGIYEGGPTLDIRYRSTSTISREVGSLSLTVV